MVERALVRVVRGHEPVGVGFLASADLVLTCAHVVGDAPAADLDVPLLGVGARAEVVHRPEGVDLVCREHARLRGKPQVKGSAVAEYVEVRTEDGDLVPFELDEEYDGPVRAGRWNPVERAEETLEHGIERARKVARSVAAKIGSMPSPRPDKVAVEIGLKVSSSAALAIAKSSAEAHVKITVEWHRDRLPTEAPPEDNESKPQDDGSKPDREPGAEA